MQITLLWLSIFDLQNVIDAKTVVTFREYVLLTSRFSVYINKSFIIISRKMFLLLKCSFVLPWQDAYLSYTQHPRFKRSEISHDAIIIEFLIFCYCHHFVQKILLWSRFSTKLA